MSNKIWTAQLGTQTEALSATWCNELFFGGARGGGKSDFLIADFLQDVDKYKEAWQGVLFRRTYPELQEIIKRTQSLYPATGAIWNEQKKEWSWKNGAKLYLRYLEHPRDAVNYQGHQYTWIGWDELTNWSSSQGYDLIKACLRSAYNVPTKRIRSSGNPGGVGHHWVKERFIDISPARTPYFDENTKMWRMFIPSKVQDNKKLLLNDPNYINRLKGVGSPELVRAWLDGDWNVLLGAYFPEFNEKHIIEPFKIPSHWVRFRSMDWGSTKPFVVQWWTVSDGACVYCNGSNACKQNQQPCLIYPPNSLIMYREWYGGYNNVGFKLSIQAVAEGILEREMPDEKFSYSVCDPACFKEDGGISIAEHFATKKVFFNRGDNQRIPGWNQVRARLIGVDNTPLLCIFKTCLNSIRTIPALQHSIKKPEDVETDSDDHCGDAMRYACMSRPFMRKLELEKPLEIETKLIAKDLFSSHLRRMKSARG